MKKLMIALAAVACAAGVQAASFEWKSTLADGSEATKLVDDSGTVISAMPTGNSIWLVKLVAADLESFAAGTWSAESATAIGQATIGTSSKAKGKISMKIDIADYASRPFSDGDVLAAVLKTADGYTQIRYYDSDKVVTDVYTASGMAAAQGKGEFDLWSDTFKFATEGNFVGTAVPEPTSGLLLLLGVAGLALRRRRA